MHMMALPHNQLDSTDHAVANNTIFLRMLYRCFYSLIDYAGRINSS